VVVVVVVVAVRSNKCGVQARFVILNVFERFGVLSSTEQHSPYVTSAGQMLLSHAAQAQAQALQAL